MQIYGRIRKHASIIAFIGLIKEKIREYTLILKI